MAKFRVENPDGSVYEIEQPDSAPAARPKNMRAGSLVDSTEQGTVGDYLDTFRAGVADAGIKAKLGVSQFFGGLSEEEKGVKRMMEEEVKAEKNGFTRGAGDIAANVALTAIPGQKLAQVAQGGVKAATTGRALAGAVASAAGTEGLFSVGEGDSFGEQMLGKAKNAAVSGALAGTLQKIGQVVSRPFQASTEAERLFRQGINPTLQQGAESKTGRFIGGLSSGSARVANRQADEGAQAIAKRVTGGAVNTADLTGGELVDTLRHHTGAEYGSIYGNKRFDLTPTDRGEMVRRVQVVNRQGQFQKDASEAGKIMGDLVGPADMNTKNLRLGWTGFKERYRDKLHALMYDDKLPQGVRDRLKEGGKVLDDARDRALSPAEIAQRNGVDIRQFDVERLSEAVGPRGERTGISLGALERAYAGKTMPGNTTATDIVGPMVRVIGGAAGQQNASRAGVATGRRIGQGAAVLGLAGGASGVLPAMAATLAVPYAISLAGQTPKGAKALMGQYAMQQAIADYLRNGGAAGVAGASFTNQE